MTEEKKEASGTERPAAPPRRRGRFGRRLLVLAIVLSALLLLGTGGLQYAEYRTSQAQFCASCHIMEPYYDSWHNDVHGEKLQVACVECHYAPGEQTTLKAKFRGLSQVTSYFSGRYGATRPRAHVSNLGCMTAKCHGDNKFMDKPITIGTVRFLHSRHLQHGDELEKPHEERLAALEGTLKNLVGEEHFAELASAALESGPADDRHKKLVSLCQQWNVTAERDVLVEFTQLRHRQVRIAQLRDLQCTNCHSYGSKEVGAEQNSSAHHFHVSTTTCFTCHFNNEGYNTGTNKCLMCHTPPQQEITVHAETTTPAGEKLVEKLVKMNHTEILARKVDCRSCHADTAHQDSTVTRRDCERCHDQPRFFADWKEPFTVDQVMRYHQVHVAQQRAGCLDCHSEIQHKLIPNGDGHDGEFLSSILTRCTQCHPNHHLAQVDLLLGRGGLAVPKSTPNLMFGARTNCTGCHTELSRDQHGDSIKATQGACIACHGDRHKDTFNKWKLGLELVMTDAQAAYDNARKMLDEKTDAPAEARAKATKLLDEAQADLELVKRGNGLHNVTYAIELLDAVTNRSQQAMAALSGN
ncbi:MAG: NapC/NirT family cytochrome c [Planctomycetia bacterium]|nr:NapC/NirT family cytochrome c [Planctomycetia bacterium]